MNTDIPDTIQPDECLWRAIFDEAKTRGSIHLKTFLERIGECTISTNRFKYADSEERERVKTFQEKERGRSIKGWVRVHVNDANNHGRQVEPDRLPSNKYHSNIILPDLPSNPEQAEVAQTKHAKQLRDLAERADLHTDHCCRDKSGQILS